jgi:steroid delta-isomerase-like uncharacterized protein
MADNPLEVVQRYFDAWNRRDTEGIVATFAEGGTYTDPSTQGPLAGDAIGAFANGLWTAFPDLSFDIVSVAQNDSGLVSAEWLMKGTNTGPMLGLPPTGATLALPGSDFVRVEGGKIRSVQGYFDSGALPLALGLDVIVQPKAIGPFTFGTATRASSGSKAAPGAFSITCVESRTEEEKTEVRDSARKIATELLNVPGFISFVGATCGSRQMTITAWESPEAIAVAMKAGEHRAAVSRFFTPELTRGGTTGVWAPLRLNTRWIRCEACSKMGDSEKLTCGCGARLPEPISYW